ncbi:type IV secretory pathway VirB6-like protein [Pedobacter sp. AK013]|uniref:hypothetical protein n=1 Tax=Pedobacter sp. AK013 TaxID=2723071 RepID=UPI00160F326D|nr:hypothetical protein [Pedobacter sp. AK013]MBB6236609.1 type IV secretory pathway VirB6-like protein [Pedobacter sp. AK013]
MKQLLFLLFFIIFIGLQIAHAAAIGGPEVILLIMVGLISIAVMIGFVFLCLYLFKRSKRVENEK